MTTIFDSARKHNHTCYTGRIFGRDIPAGWPEFHGPGSNPNRPIDADDPTEFAPRFQPSRDDDQWNADSSPLNHTAEELDADDSFEFFANYPDPESFEEFELAVLNGQFGYTRETA